MSRQRRREKKRGGFLGKLAALLLGFILGIVGTIGGIVGGGYYIASSVKIKDAVNGIADATGAQIDYSQYLTEEYAEKTVLGVIGALGPVMEEFQNGTGSLSTLEKISPYIRTAVSKLAQTTANFGVPIDVDTLMTTPFAELASFAQSTINAVELGKVIELATGNTSGMISLLCYGEEGVHYEVDGEGKIQMLGSNKPLTVGALTTDEGINGVLGNISLSALMESVGGVNANDSIMRALLYGTKGIDYEEIDGEIQMKPVYFRYDQENDCFVDDANTLYSKTAEGYLSANGTIIKENDTQNGGNEYAYTVYDKNGKSVYELKLENGQFNAYKNDVVQKHRGLTIGDLMGGKDLTSIFETLVIGDFIAPNPENANAIQLAIAYGEKNLHYTVSGNTVQMLPVQIAVLGNNAYDAYGAQLNATVTEYNADGYKVAVNGGKTYYLEPENAVKNGDNTQRTVKVNGGNAPLYYGAIDTRGTLDYYRAHTIGSFLTGNIFDDMLNALTIGDIMGGDITQENSPLVYAVKDWKISSFKDGEMINSLTISDLISVGNDSPAILQAIKNWTIGELTSAEKFNSLTIGDLIEVKENSPQILKTIANWTLSELQTSNKFDELTIGDLIEVTESSPEIVKTLSTWTIAKLKTNEAFDTLTIGDLIEVTETSPEILKTLSTWTIAKLKTNEAFDTLTIGDLIEVTETSPEILKTLSTWTIAKLKTDDAFDTLTIADLIEVTQTSPKILQTLSTWTIAKLKTEGEFDTLTIGDLIDFTEDSPKILQTLSTWTIAKFKTEGAFDDLILGELVEINQNDPEVSKFLKTLAGWKIADLKIQSKFEDLYIRELIDIDTTSADTPEIMKVLADWQLKDLKDKSKFNNLKVNQLVEVTETSPGILKKIGTWTIAQMQDQNQINQLQVNDLFTVSQSSPPILQAIQDWTLGRLQDEREFERLQIQQIIKVTDSSPAILQAIKTWTLEEMQEESKFESLKINQLIEVSESAPAILQAIKDWSIGDLKNQAKFDELPLNKLFTVTESSPAILQAIENWTLADMQNQAKFDDLFLRDLIEIDEQSAPAILLAIKDWQLKDLRNQDKFDDLKINQLVTINEADAPNILLAIKDWSIKDLTSQTMFDSLTLKEVLGEDEVNQSKYFRTIGDTPISQLSTAIEKLNLTDLFGNDIFRTITINGTSYFAYTDLDGQGNEILYRLYDKTEGGVTKFYLEPTYQTQVEIRETHIRYMPTFINGEGEVQLLYHYNGKYYLDPQRTQESGFSKGNSQVTYRYYTAQNRLYEKIENGELFYYEDAEFTVPSKREAEGIWHYMLMNEQGELETNPTLGDMDAMIENMQNNIRNATLNQLEEDGVVKFKDGEENITEYKLKKHIELQVMYQGQPLVFDIGDENSSYANKEYIGELTVMEMLEYLTDVFTAIDILEDYDI